jgi:hypothetical protein
MTREQQIRAALRLLGPRIDHKDDLRSDIEAALVSIEMADPGHPLGTKHNKQQLKKISAALQRAQAAADQLPFEMRFILTREPPSVAWLEEYIQLAEQWLAEPTAPPGRPGHKQRNTVIEASYLLAKYSLPIWATRKGLWHKLSAILFGDLKADLFRHMLAVSAPRGRLIPHISRPDPGRK